MAPSIGTRSIRKPCGRRGIVLDLLGVLALAGLMLACTPRPLSGSQALPPLVDPEPAPPPPLACCRPPPWRFRFGLEGLPCLPTERNAIVRATAAPGPDQTARLYFRWDDPAETVPERKAFYWVPLEAESGGRFWAILPEPEHRNERVVYYGALVDSTGAVIARSAETPVPVRRDCDVRLTRKEQGVAQNLTLGETLKEQQGDRVWGFLCDGVVTRVNHEGIRRADETCRACAVAWWRKDTAPRPRVAKPPKARESTPAVDKSLRFVRLFYGTNRARTAPCAQVTEARWDGRGRCRPGEYYSGLLASDTGKETQGLEVGTAAVTFPPSHSRERSSGRCRSSPSVFATRIRPATW